MKLTEDKWLTPFTVCGFNVDLTVFPFQILQITKKTETQQIWYSFSKVKPTILLYNAWASSLHFLVNYQFSLSPVVLLCGDLQKRLLIKVIKKMSLKVFLLSEPENWGCVDGLMRRSEWRTLAEVGNHPSIPWRFKVIKCKPGRDSP